ncbi:hypothetical protein [Sedimentibacter sp.]|uniref:hypothetical protein n=1 Tax=Sedimentibacter sp. TaxID=1960295 RepID=UPI0028A785E0|nr:hypothetical protein [Sedimentibacter sp.]
MGIMKLSSQITFLYFEKLDEARTFFEDISLNSFLFTGPEGYKFEVQQFETEELLRLF